MALVGAQEPQVSQVSPTDSTIQPPRLTRAQQSLLWLVTLWLSLSPASAPHNHAITRLPPVLALVSQISKSISWLASWSWATIKVPLR